MQVPTAALSARLQTWLDGNYPGVNVRETVLGHVVRGGNPSALDRVIAQRLGFGAVVACEQGHHDVMLGWDTADGVGSETADSYVRRVPIDEVLQETARLLDGSSTVVKRRVALLSQVKAVLAL